MDTIDQATGEITAPPLACSREFGNLAGALAKAQGAIGNPKRDRTVKVQTKTGGSYEFSYATLGAVLDAIRKPLSDNALSYTHTLVERANRYRLVTRIMHSSGQWIESETPLFIADQSNQSFGSALSYMKRYALCALLGVAADEDDDGNAADGNSAEKKDRAAPNGGARKMTVKTEPKDDPARKLADEIKATIDTAPTLKALNDGMAARGEDFTSANPKADSDLAFIREASREAFAFLIDRANKKRGILSQAPSKAAE